MNREEWKLYFWSLAICFILLFALLSVERKDGESVKSLFARLESLEVSRNALRAESQKNGRSLEEWTPGFGVTANGKMGMEIAPGVIWSYGGGCPSIGFGF